MCIELVRQELGVGLLLADHVLEYIKTGELVKIQVSSTLMPISSTLYIAQRDVSGSVRLESEVRIIESVFSDAAAICKASKR